MSFPCTARLSETESCVLVNKTVNLESQEQVDTVVFGPKKVLSECYFDVLVHISDSTSVWLMPLRDPNLPLSHLQIILSRKS